MIAESQYAGREIKGAREYQEDYYAFLDAFEGQTSSNVLAAALADGMGGHHGGGQAARIAVNAFLEWFATTPQRSIRQRLRASLEHATRRIRETSASDPQLADMGCTFIGVCITDAGLEKISIGDSMLYLFRENVLKRINADHTMARYFDEKVMQGEMTAEEAASHPHRQMLSSALTAEPPALADLSTEPLPLFPNDVIIAASDGLKTLSEDQMVGLLQYAHTQNAAELADSLLQAVASRQHPKQDNATVLTVCI